MTRVSRPVPRPTTAQKRDTSLLYANQLGVLGALEARAGDGAQIPRVNVRMPMYKANDSSDLHLMELISPSHELQRKLVEVRRPMNQPHHSPNKSVDGTPRTPANVHFTKYNNQRGSKNFTKNFNWGFFAADAPSRPRTATGAKKDCGGSSPLGAQQVQEKKCQDQIHRHREGFEDVGIYSKEFSTRQERVNTSELADLDLDLKYSRTEDQKASDLRLVSKLWHQECKISVTIQERLAYLLTSKYKEAFDDGRMHTLENCKHNDFKAEVARILKKRETAGAPQLPTLTVKYELAVACVEEVLGKGMGEEYMKLEMNFLHPISGNSLQFNMRSSRNANQVKEIAERVLREYKDVRNITGFMVDQLSLFDVASLVECVHREKTL